MVETNIVGPQCIISAIKGMIEIFLYTIISFFLSNIRFLLYKQYIPNMYTCQKANFGSYLCFVFRTILLLRTRNFIQ